MVRLVTLEKTLYQSISQVFLTRSLDRLLSNF